MKKLTLILISILLTNIASAQCMMYPVLLNERIQHSNLVVEGKVIDKVSFWNNQHNKIFTSNLIEVYKTFKGSSPAYIEIITEGGVVGDKMHKIEPALQLRQEEMGVFTLIPNSEPSQFGKSVYEAFASAQGFIKYDVYTNTANEPFKKYENISSTLYDLIDSYTQNTYSVIRPINVFQISSSYNNSVQAVAAITGISPTTITAGTQSILTITGSGFGTTINAAQIQFRKADDGGATFISPVTSEIVSWTSTQIQVRVPSGAGTGIVRVQGVNSTQTLTISYAHQNVNNSGSIYLTKHIGQTNGGYAWTYNGNFFNNAAAKASFERAFQNWRCGTFINWSISTGTTSIAASASDNVNIITFNSSLPTGVLGNCGSYWSGCGSGATMSWYVDELDIQFSTTPGSGLTWQYGTANPTTSQYDFESVAAHELGHGHQLGHVISSPDLMHFSISNGQTKRNLNTNDINGGNAVMTRNTTAGGTCSNPLMTPLNSSNCSLSGTSTPTASFTGPTSACVNQAVTFTNTSTGNPTSYTWTTTGATAATSTATNAAFTFTATGVRTVTLVASNGSSSSTTTRTITINPTPTVAVTSASICAGTPTVLTASGANTYSWSTGATTSTISVSPTTNTTYTVRGTNTTGCSQTKTTTVTVSATPTVVVNSATICSGSSATLTASGATSYSWNTGSTSASISVSPTANTTYTVRGTNAAGCSQTKTTSVIVTSSPSVTVNSATICAGTSTILTASGANTYTWSTGAQTTTLSVNPTSTTVYTVTGRLTGCATSNVKTATVTVNATPTVAVTSASICAGTSTVLTASGANTYSWSSGATTSTVSVSPTTNTTYTVRGTNSLGCSQTKTATISINSSPNVTINSATICSGSSATLTASGASTYSWNTGSTNASISVSPTSNTTYTVKGTNALGCSQTKTTSVIVTSSPVISVNSATICQGNNTTLTASGVTSYTWNTGSNNASISVSPVSTTVYTVSGTSNGCPSSVSKTATVTVNQNPNVTLSAVNLSVCSNSAQQTLNGSPSGGTYSGTGVSGNSFSPTNAGAGNHTVNYNFTNSNGCSGSANINFTVSICTGINEFESKLISVYPNPAKDLINIELNNLSEMSKIEMYDVIGKLVYSVQTKDSLIPINVNELNNGVYTIRIINNQSSYLKRFIKE